MAKAIGVRVGIGIGIEWDDMGFGMRRSMNIGRPMSVDVE